MRAVHLDASVGESAVVAPHHTPRDVEVRADDHVGVEGDERGLVDAHRGDEGGGQRGAWKRKQSLAFVREDVSDGPFALHGVRSRGGDVLEEVQERRIARVERGNRARGEEAPRGSG